jgi:hypothetical protein
MSLAQTIRTEAGLVSGGSISVAEPLMDLSSSKRGNAPPSVLTSTPRWSVEVLHRRGLCRLRVSQRTNAARGQDIRRNTQF